jgi:hypothetical protein
MQPRPINVDSLGFESTTMSFDKMATIEAAIDAVLSDHFENCQNPHETIHKIWLLLNADSTLGSELNICLVHAERKYH